MSEPLTGRTATTNHGERVIVIGAAHDPARVKVQPVDQHGQPIPGTEYFTPRIARLNFDPPRESPASLAVTRRAEIIREQTGCSWESACARAELERDLSGEPASYRPGSYFCRHCQTPDAMPGHDC